MCECRSVGLKDLDFPCKKVACIPKKEKWVLPVGNRSVSPLPSTFDCGQQTPPAPFPFPPEEADESCLSLEPWDCGENTGFPGEPSFSSESACIPVLSWGRRAALAGSWVF